MCKWKELKMKFYSSVVETTTEGACKMLCKDAKMKCFMKDTTLQSWTRETLESHEKNITCSEVSSARVYASGLSVVFTLTVAYNGIAIACKRYTLI